MNAIKQMLTDPDNITHNVLKHGVFWGFIAVVGMQVYSIIQGQVFNPISFGVAIGAILGGGGLGIGADAKGAQK